MSQPNAHHLTSNNLKSGTGTQGSNSNAALAPVPILPNPDTAARPSVLSAAALPAALGLINTVNNNMSTVNNVNGTGNATLTGPSPEVVAAAATWQLMQQALVGGNLNLNALHAAALLNNNHHTHTQAQPQLSGKPQPQHTRIPGNAQQQSLENGKSPQQQSSLPVPSNPVLQSTAPGKALPLLPNAPNVAAHSSLAVSSVSSEPPVSMVLSNRKTAHYAGAKKRRAQHEHEYNDSSCGYNSKGGNKSRRVEASFESSSHFSFDSLVPPVPKTEEELAKMTPAERRRYERNLREQQRSYRISQQIKELRDVLADGNIPYKPNKFSILVSVTEYIKQLQSRAIMLDAEHQKLITTISQSSEPPAGQSSSSSEDSDKDAASLQSTTENYQDLLVQGIDYGSVFKSCPFAIGVASLDGRVLACNEKLETLLGCDQGEGENKMVEQSLFLYIRNHQEIFEAMADLLKRSSLGSSSGVGETETDGQELKLPDNTNNNSNQGNQLLYWCGKILSQKAQRLHFTLTLTTTPDSSPKYFSFSASPVSTNAS